jgi:hypothetical protein
LTLARNVLLYTILIDEAESDSCPLGLWHLFYDFSIDMANFDLIFQQSTKLCQLSDSLATWHESEYGQSLRMVNSETLSILNHYWDKYRSNLCGTTPFMNKFQAARRKEYEGQIRGKHYLGLSASGGTLCQVVPALDRKAESLTLGYSLWECGHLHHHDDDAGYRNYANPLFAFSELAGNQFAINCNVAPILGFHLVNTLATLHSKNKENTVSVQKLAADSARNEFYSWCDAFRRVIREMKTGGHPGICIRFVVAEAVLCSIGLNSLQTGHVSGNIYSRPWSAHPLQFNGYGGKNPAPTSFNVIDTAFLPDKIGLLNLLLQIVPLLKPSASVLYTGLNAYSVKEESDFLTKMLCGDVTTMCAFFGIAPTSYLTRLTTRAYNQDNPTYEYSKTPVNNRVTWRLTTAGDSQSNPAHAFPCCKSDELITFMFSVYLKMFNRQSLIDASDTPPSVRTFYTRNSFAQLMSFVGEYNVIQELQLHFNLSAAYSEEASEEPLGNNPDISRRRNDTGVLSRHHPPETTAVVITLPRGKIQPIYNEVARTGVSLAVVFRVLFFMFDRGIPQENRFQSIHPVFGKLITAEDGESGTIETDLSGWDGRSDLQLCMYIPTITCLIRDPLEGFFSVRLFPDLSVFNTFKGRFGKDLEVFKVPLFDKNNVHLFEALPHLKPLTPVYPQPCVTADLAEETDTALVNYPLYNLQHQKYHTLISKYGRMVPPYGLPKSSFDHLLPLQPYFPATSNRDAHFRIP